MAQCTKNLRASAMIITTVLHHTTQSTMKFNTFCLDEGIDWETESKNTRRNSQYKTSAIYMIYYIIYTVYYNKKPSNINFILSDKEANIINYETPDGVKKTGPIQHYNQFRNYTYTYPMVQLVDASMRQLVDFGIDEYFKWCGICLAITLTLKRVQKRSSSKKRKNVTATTYRLKRRKISNSDESILFGLDDEDDEEDEDEDEDETTFINPDNRAVVELMTPYQGLSIAELKEKARLPSVLLKFYQAWLMECDWVMLFTVLSERLKVNSCPPAQVRKLLQYSIAVMCKYVYAHHERGGYIDRYIRMLKAYQQQSIVTELLGIAIRYKFRQYPIPPMPCSSSSDEVYSYNFRQFETFARNTQEMHYHVTPFAVNLAVSIYQRKVNGVTYSLKLIHYVNQNKYYLFDVVHISGVDDEILGRMSWYARLRFLQSKNLLYGEPEYTFIKLLPITLREIQFENIASGPNVHVYIRLGGLGLGTMFHREKIGSKETYAKGSARSRTGNRVNNVSRRFPRLASEDLVSPNTLEVVRSSNNESSNSAPNVNTTVVTNTTNTTEPFNLSQNMAVMNMMQQILNPNNQVMYAALQQQFNQQQEILKSLQHQPSQQMNPYINNTFFPDSTFPNYLLTGQGRSTSPPLQSVSPARSPSPPPPLLPDDFVRKYTTYDDNNSNLEGPDNLFDDDDLL